MSDQEQGRLASLLADWLVAIDDGLCYRHVRCTNCGSLADGFYDIATLDDGLCVSYRVCEPCQRQDPTRVRVGKLLEQRYARRQTPGG